MDPTSRLGRGCGRVRRWRAMSTVYGARAGGERGRESEWGEKEGQLWNKLKGGRWAGLSQHSLLAPGRVMDLYMRPSHSTALDAATLRDY